MRKTSLIASSAGIEKAKIALTSKAWSQEQLAEELETTRPTVNKFFTGKSVNRKLFVQICEKLGLNWQEICGLSQTLAPQSDEHGSNNSINIDSLVQEVREKIKPLIEERCGTMRVLDMAQPIGLNDIYTKVNILEKITGRRRKESFELLKECEFENFDRFGLGRITEKRVPGLEAVEKYSKLMILGKPGAGKTTFLKYLAIQSIKGNYESKIVTIFITLKDFAEATNKPTLLEYINQQFSASQVTAAQVAELFKHNKTLVLLDGLDEVREEDSLRVLKEIRDFSDHYRDNRFVMTCRIAAREYTFEKFSEVEVADFDDEQIATFANNWFKNKAVKAEDFLQRLRENHRIYELATNPLLLTLLCLGFEESGDFPANRSELYKEGIDALLKKWDAKRGIQREQLVYKKLSIQRKEDLLSKIAMNTFERSDYFFKQKVAEQHIIEYIRNLPNACTDPEALQVDSERVLKSIEAQHGLLVERAKGIYSFSHLTFHEYFTAREFVVGKQSSEEALRSLVSHITDYRWQEVFLLAVGMSPSADRLLLLMKQKIDGLIADNEKLQQFLVWVNQKSFFAHLPYRPAAVRAFYFSFNHIYYLDDSFYLACTLGLDDPDNYSLPIDDARSLNNFIGLDKDFQVLLEFGLSSSFSPNDFLADRFEYILSHEFYELEPGLKRSLKQLKDELPNPNQEDEGFQQWWKANGQNWGEKLRAVMIKYRNIGHDWQFNNEQQEALLQYYEANSLLVDCLNSDCYVSREVRQYIEDTLLLPIAEIEKRPRPTL